MTVVTFLAVLAIAALAGSMWLIAYAAFGDWEE